MRKSNVLAKLRGGKVAVGCGVSLGVSTLLPGLAGKLGMDFIWIDMEHRWFSFRDVALMVLAGREGGTDPMVRIPDTSPTTFYRSFELGAAGIMVPHGRSVADAEHAVKNSKFHPQGERGMETVGVDADFGVAPLAEFLPWHNRETFVVLQIEEKEAVDSVEKIAEVPGIDVLFVGPGDLLQSYGKPGQLDAEELPQAMKRVAAACRKNNKWWGLPTGPDPEKIRKYLDLGARFIIPFGDYSTIARTWKAGMENVQNLLAGGNW